MVQVSVAEPHRRDDLVNHLPASTASRILAHLDKVIARESFRYWRISINDHCSRQHSERVADLAQVLAQALGWPADDAAAVCDAGLVHDVGKIAVPDAILFKPDRLTPAEFERVKAHGQGYPDGIAAEAIPEGARILTLADAWDVMTSDRPYGVPLSREDALAECRRCSGAQFWPAAVDALERALAGGLLPPGR